MNIALSLIICLFLFLTPKLGSAKDLALLISQDSSAFELIIDGMTDEFDTEISLKKVNTRDTQDIDAFADLISSVNPNVVILMGNKAISQYYALQQQQPKLPFPISIAVAAVFVDEQIKELKNSVGIQYEIPIAASVAGLRSIANDSIQRVGVLYSPRLKSIIEYNKAVAALENIELIAIEMPSNKKPSARQLKKHLKKVTSLNIDALWVTNDTNLLDQNLIENAWKPILRRFKSHVIVGVRNLMTTELKFGNIAVFPDHYELGVQTADFVFRLREENWEPATLEAEPPISIKKHFNLMLTEQYRLSVNRERLNEFDEIIY